MNLNSYLWVAERQKNGTIHFHPLTNDFMSIKEVNGFMAKSLYSEKKKGVEAIREIFRVLKPQGRLLVLDIAVPSGRVSGKILKLFLGFMLKHDLEELLPALESSGFSQAVISRARFRVMGLPILSFLRAEKQSI